MRHGRDGQNESQSENQFHSWIKAVYQAIPFLVLIQNMNMRHGYSFEWIRRACGEKPLLKLVSPTED